MDQVEVQRPRTSTGRAEVIAEDPEIIDEAPLVATPTTRYAETRVATPVGRPVGQVVSFVVGVVDGVLALDFMFRAFSANANGFRNFIYDLGGPLAAPFDGIFGNTTNYADTGGVVRWADLLAIGIYSLVAVGLIQLARIGTTPDDAVSSSSSTTIV